MNILVLGGTGYAGEAIVEELLFRGHTPILVIRPGSEKKLDAKVLQKCKVIEGEARNFADFEGRLQDYDISSVIYAIGLIREYPRRGIRFVDAHVNWVRDVLALAKNLGVRNFILISAAGVEMAETGYQKSKLAGEKLVRQSGLDFQIFRPEIMLGPSTKYHFMQVLRQLNTLPIVPIPGGGQFEVAPLHRRDLAAAVVTVLASSTTPRNRVWGLGGKEILKFRDLVLRVSPYPVQLPVPVPFLVLKPAGRFFRYLRYFPVTDEQLIMLEQPLAKEIEDSTQNWRELGIEPRSLEKILEEYE